MGDFAALRSRKQRHFGAGGWVKGLSFEMGAAIGNNFNDFSQIARRNLGL